MRACRYLRRRSNVHPPHQPHGRATRFQHQPHGSATRPVLQNLPHLKSGGLAPVASTISDQTATLHGLHHIQPDTGLLEETKNNDRPKRTWPRTQEQTPYEPKRKRVHRTTTSTQRDQRIIKELLNKAKIVLNKLKEAKTPKD